MAQEIDLSGCQLVTDLGIRALTSSCRKLESVNVSSCYELSDAAFESLGTCSSLRSLDACGCEQLTDVGLQALARGSRYASSVILPAGRIIPLSPGHTSAETVLEALPSTTYGSIVPLFSKCCFCIFWESTVPNIVSDIK